MGLELSAAAKSGQSRTTHVQSSSDGDFTVEVFCALSDEIARRWQALESESDLTPFQSFQFAKQWYDVFSEDGLCEALIAVVRSEPGGRDIMLFPLCRRRKGGLWVVEFADGGVSDYNAPVIAKRSDINEACMERIWLLLKPMLAADVVHFDKSPLTINGRFNPVRFINAGTEMEFGGHALSLPGGAGLPLLNTGAIPSGYASKLNAEKRRLEKQGTLKFETANADTAVAVFSVLCDQRQQRSGALGRKNSLDDPRIKSFYLKLVESSAQSGFCKIDSLVLDETVLATALGLSHGGSYYLLLPAFASGQYARHSPGNLLLFLQMQRLQSEGGKTYDFTIGDEPYKGRFGANRSPLVSVSKALTLKGQPSIVLRTARLLWRRRDEFSRDRMKVAAAAFKNKWFALAAATLSIYAFADF